VQPLRKRRGIERHAEQLLRERREIGRRLGGGTRARGLAVGEGPGEGVAESGLETGTVGGEVGGSGERAPGATRVGDGRRAHDRADGKEGAHDGSGEE